MNKPAQLRRKADPSLVRCKNDRCAKVMPSGLAQDDNFRTMLAIQNLVYTVEAG